MVREPVFVSGYQTTDKTIHLLREDALAAQAKIDLQELVRDTFPFDLEGTSNDDVVWWITKNHDSLKSILFHLESA